MTPLLGKLTVQEANALIKTLLTYPASLKHGTGLSEEETLALARFAWVNGFDEDFQRDCLAKYQSDFTRPAMHWWELEDLKVACMTQEEFMTTEYKIATRSSSCAINIPVLRLSYRVAQLEKFKGFPEVIKKRSSFLSSIIIRWRREAHPKLWKISLRYLIGYVRRIQQSYFGQIHNFGKLNFFV
eukprot:TRINITY_DN16332_c0_g2_i2.p2 TRINITY_DN16332_c0_g2~~TRINITY_DN16332_c0_g2_i2.p2  ORF type:complete len:205 (-),score=20.48 TRINITY_DN16332_c0_g2_i2:566-1120(-)